MRLTSLATCLILAILPLLWLPALPALPFIQAIAVAGFLLALIRHNVAATVVSGCSSSPGERWPRKVRSGQCSI